MTDVDDLQELLTAGEALRYHGALRSGGRVGLTDDRLLVVTDHVTSIELDGIEEVTVQSVDWFLVLLSVLLVGFGVYSTRFNLLGGVAFALFGLASCYWTYRNRNEVLVHARGRAKPIPLYPAETKPFQAALEDALAHRQSELDVAAGESTG